MAIKFVHKKDGTYITSDKFDDMKMVGQSQMEHNEHYWDNRRNKDMDDGAIQLGYAVLKIRLWHEACQEITNFVDNLKPEQLANYAGTIYKYGKDVDENDTSLAEYDPEMVIEGMDGE